ncbi:hypothetical protein EYF80_035352 [Liparis tanakae]|uniref:Uncharacterized protein n=1 Tax=Liparis tanakae TaxID=230148 RepID=A0A4Z2GNQ5_9TELE|nr:hypothetical protein EYF80_035352 [Liparis tanakae]
MERGKRKNTARLDSSRQAATDADTYNFLKTTQDRGTCHTVPSGELHIRELGDISTFRVLGLRALQVRSEAFLAVVSARLPSEAGKRLSHCHTWKTQDKSVTHSHLGLSTVHHPEFNVCRAHGSVATALIGSTWGSVGGVEMSSTSSESGSVTTTATCRHTESNAMAV